MIRHTSLLALLLFGSTGLLAQPAFAQQDTPAPQTVEVPSFAEAQAFIGAGDFQAASVAFAKIVIDQPNNSTAWQMLGYSLHMNGDLDRALRVHQKAATFPNVRPIAMYNVACVHSLQGRHDEAFEALHLALDAGFDDFNLMGTDADLRPLHGDARWAALGERVHGTPAQETAPAEAAQTPAPAEATGKRMRGDGFALDAVAVGDQFDFWIGDWEVWMNGEMVSEWQVQEALDGSVIQQTGPNSMTVVNYEPTTKKWHMTWMSGRGHHDVLVGGVEGDAIVMHQKVVREAPGSIGRWIMRDLHQNYFISDWQLSADGGKTWQTDSTMEYWRKGAPRARATTQDESAAVSKAAQQYDFMLGKYQVHFKAMTPDQDWVEGSGVYITKKVDDTTIVEEQLLTLKDGTTWNGTATRKLDPKTGKWSVRWVSEDGSMQVDSMAVATDSGVQEIATGEDQYGTYRDVVTIETLGPGGYSVRLDRTYMDGDQVLTTINGLYEAKHTNSW